MSEAGPCADPPDLTADPPDLTVVELAAGGRAFVASDLHLGAAPSAASAAAAHNLAAALDAWAGPGAVIFAGDVFELWAPPDAPPDLAAILAAHPELVCAVARFAGGADRRVVVLPGNHDGRLAWDRAARRTLALALRAEVALAVELVAEGEGGGPARRVRVEHGHRFDPANAFADPRSPTDSPLGQHIAAEILPRLLGPGGGRWLAGVESLADPVDFPSFVGSRLTYRQAGRRVWWLLAPLLAALALRAPVAADLLPGASAGLTRGARVVADLGLAVLADVLVLVAVVYLVARRQFRPLADLDLGRRGQAQNDPARAEAARLVAGGYAGFVTGHTHHPELAEVDGGFYANTGCGSAVVEAVPARFGLPPVFRPTRRLSWVELDAAAVLHVRLLHGEAPLPGLSRLERAVLWPGPRIPSGGGGGEPAVVAALPGGAVWPTPPDRAMRRARRARRLAAGGALLAGLLNVVSAQTPPLAGRLAALEDALPGAVPRAAAAVVALAGLGLLLLARGLRRGQRHAWVLALALLAASALGHALKGIDLEEASVCLVVAYYVGRGRAAFTAGRDAGAVVHGVAVLLAGVGVAAASAATSVLLYAPAGGRPTLGAAARAVLGRLVGLREAPLPAGLAHVLDPALAATGSGAALAGAAMAVRALAAARRARPTPGGAGAARARAAALVRRHGAGTLDWFALRDDKDWFVWNDTVVAYAVWGGACIVSPDPIGPPSQRMGAWRAFTAFAEAHGWTVAVLAAGEAWLPVYRSAGLHDLYLGDEAIVDVAGFTLEGAARKRLRQACSRARRAGCRVELRSPAELAPAEAAELLELAGRARPGGERGFSMTLGRVCDPADDELLVAAAYDAEGRAVAFCQFVPAAELAGWSLDVMRRRPDAAPNGVMDYLLVETIRWMQARGGRALGLNFAALRAVVAGEAGAGLVRRAERRLLQRLSESLQIGSLLYFNERFQPRWQPRYLVFDAPEHLPTQAAAIAALEGLADLPRLRRRPAG